MNNKYLLFFALVTISLNVFSQNAPFVEVIIDTPSSTCNAGESTNLHANYTTIKQTNDYAVSSIIYNPQFSYVFGNGNGGVLIPATGDDKWSTAVNQPFPFCFFGNAYNQLLVGTNGVVTFDFINQSPGGGCAWSYSATIPNPTFPIRNSIYGVYQDTNIATPPVTNPLIQNVNYYFLNTGANAPPNRAFVANFNELPQFSCNNGVGLQTSQIVIHETTNIIDVNVSRRTSCTGWNSGSGLIGVQNAAGTIGRFPTGRNTGAWSATNEAYRFTPNGAAPVPSRIEWTIPPSTTVIGTSADLVVVPTTGPTIYRATVFYTRCDMEVSVYSEVTVKVEPPLPVLDPHPINICTVLPPPYLNVNINQDSYILNGAIPSDYIIKYYDTNVVDATNDAPNNILTPGSYLVTSVPKTIYVRIEDQVNPSGCANVRSFIINAIAGPQGTFTYPSTPYCTSLSSAQPILPVTLSPGGSFSSSPIGLDLNSSTGEITPSSSLVGLYTVKYNIAATASCPTYQTQATVEIIDCGCTVAASNTGPICSGGTFGLAATTVVGATYSWSGPGGFTSTDQNPVNVPSPTGAPPYIYQVTATVATGACNSFTTVVINPTPTVAVNSPTVCSGQSATVTASPGVAGTYNYSWTVPATATNPGNVSGFTTGIAGSYSVVITDSATFCASNSASGTVTVDPLPTVGVNSPVVCMGSSATVTATPGVSGSYSYAWTVPSGASAPGNTAGFSTTTAGTYSVIITNSITNCISASASGTVTINSKPTVSVSSPKICAGGTSTVLATPGTSSTYTYVWTVSAGAMDPGNVDTFNTGIAGVYSVVITDVASTCSSGAGSTTLTVDPLPTATIDNPAVCAGTASTLRAILGVAGSYTYNWTVPVGASAPGDVPIFTTTVAGTYTLVITSSTTTCSSLPVSTVVAFNPLPTVTVNNASLCAGAATTMIATPGSAGTYSYAWTVPTGAVNPGDVASFSTAVAGTYSVIITDASCSSLSASCTATVNPLPTVTVNSPTVCQGTGATVSATAGTAGSYSYSWTVPATAAAPGDVASFTATIAGTYSVIITDTATGCASLSGAGTVTHDPLPIVTVNSPAVCFGASATLVATPGSAGSYTYAWTVPTGAVNPGDTASFSTTVSGSYDVKITNTATGCASSPATGIVTINALPTVTVNSPTTCSGTAATVTATVGAGTYSYAWTVPTGASAQGDVPSFTSTFPGTYSVVITDTATTCASASASSAVTFNVLPTVTVSSPTTCAGMAVNISATAGTAGSYSYSWAVPTGATVPGDVSGFSSAIAGTYSVVITNTTTNCSSAAAAGTLSVNPNPVVGVNSPFTCPGTSSTITATPSTAGTYDYSWTVPIGATAPGNVSSFSAAVGGTYSVIITNTTTNCSSVSSSGTLTINPVPTVTANSPSTCVGAATNVVASPGIAGAYSYAWSVPAGAPAPGDVSNFNTAVGGTYSVVITNITTGCISSSNSGTVTVNSLPTVAVNSPTTCSGISTTVSATAGSAGSYSYVWTVPTGASLPGNVSTFSTTTAGIYSVIITNTTTSCKSLPGSGTVTVNPLPTVTVNSPSTCAGVVTSVVATAGSAGSYSYAWTVPTGAAIPGNVSSFSTTTAGNYSVVITNTTTGCVSASATGTASSLPTVVVNSPVICQGQSATVTASPGIAGSYSYAWIVPAGATAPGNISSFATTTAGTYSVRITNSATSCVSLLASGTVTINPLPTVVLNSPSACQGTSATMQATLGTAGTYIYSWTVPTGVSAPGGVSNFATTVDGIYSVEVTNTATGCTSLPAMGTVTINPLPTVEVNSPTICSNNPEVVMATPLPGGSYSYLWTVPAGSANPGDVQSFMTADPGTYHVIITNTLNCSGSGSGILTATVPPGEAIATASSYFAEGQIISVAVNPPGEYLYQIDNGAFQSSSEFINIVSGWHDIFVKNDCGFTTTKIRTIDYPHFFTPNGDGYNDAWNIPDLLDQPNSKIYIYDRYGKLIKEISPLGIGWDGTFNTMELPATDYWFKVYFTEDGADKVFKSHFSLKR